MTMTLMKTTVAGSLSAGIVPAVLIGAANTAGMLLTAQILFTVFLGFSPLVVTTAAVVEEKKRGILRTRLTPVTDTQAPGAELRRAPGSKLHERLNSQLTR